MANHSDWSELLFDCRWVVMGTLSNQHYPFLSKVAVVPALAGDRTGYIMHLSELAKHTQNLMRCSNVSLLFSETDDDQTRDPQRLARLTVSGIAEKIDQSSEDYSKLVERYRLKFPEAEMRFGFGDFHLFMIQPIAGYFVGGLGIARSYESKKICEVIKARIIK